MTSSKLIFFTVVFSLPITFLMLTGCAMNGDMSPGTVKQIPIQEATAGNGNKARRSIVFENGRWQTRSVAAESEVKANSPIVEQEIVTVLPLTEPPPPDYVVGPYDVLSINVSKPDFSSMGSTSGSSLSAASNLGAGTQPTGYRVDGKGNIQLPFVGTIHVWGMTLQEIQTRLMEVYPKYFKDPWVTIDVKEYRSQPLYILGQFKNTGVFYMDRPFNVLQGLAMGQGYDASTANPRAARIIRDKKVLPVDIYELLMNADQTQNIWLKPGDTIFMPDNRNRVVFVFGASKGGGPIPIPPAGLNLLQAIATAGLQEIGYHARRVFLIRSFSPTRGQLMVIDVDKIIQGDALPMALTEGDIIYIPKSGLTTWNEALGEMLPTLSAFSAILSPFVQIKYLSQ